MTDPQKDKNGKDKNDDAEFEAKLKEAMAEEEQRQAEELEILSPDYAEESARRLAQEIAEDELLAAHLAEPHSPELEAALGLPAGTETVASLSFPGDSLQTPLIEKPHAASTASPLAPATPLDVAEIESCLEALLFLSDQPISVQRLRELLQPEYPTDDFSEALRALRHRYQQVHHGIELVEVAGGLQFRTKPGRAILSKKLAKVQTQRLSRGAMETLAIIAYRQPVLKEQIDKVRGVDSSHFLRTLLERKLIQIDGRSELPGRPMLYSTTTDFLKLFGLKDRTALPPLREVEQMIPTSEAMSQEEDPRLREMRAMVEQMHTETSQALQYDPKEDEKILKQIKERIQTIPTTTPYIEEQKELEKQLAAGVLPSAAAPPEGQPELGVTQTVGFPNQSLSGETDNFSAQN